MGTCPDCSREMGSSDGCLEGLVYLFEDGHEAEAIVHGDEEITGKDGEELTVPTYIGDDGIDRCADCGAPQGETHHHHCDWERCPRCGGQLLSCDHTIRSATGQQEMA